MNNVVYLEPAFEAHARLLDWLQACLGHAVDQDQMRPSQSRELQEAAEHVGISELRCIVERVEKLLVTSATESGPDSVREAHTNSDARAPRPQCRRPT